MSMPRVSRLSTGQVAECCNNGQKNHYPPGNTLLATSKNVLFPGYNQMLTTGAEFTGAQLWRSDDLKCRVISTGG